MRHLLTLLLLAIPLVARLLHWPATAVFALSGLAIMPLAKWIGTATEHLAVHVGPSLGGLLNATFVLGLALLLGGWGRDKQTFNRTAAGVGATQLTLAVIGLLIPAAFDYTLQTTNVGRCALLGQEVSVAVAALLILSWLLGLLFSLRTHTQQKTAVDWSKWEPTQKWLRRWHA